MRGHHLNMKQVRLWALLRNISNSTSSTMDLFGTITPKQNVPSILCILGRGCIPPMQGRLCLCGSLETPSAHRSEALHISYQHGDGVATFFFFSPHEHSLQCSHRHPDQLGASRCYSLPANLTQRNGFDQCSWISDFSLDQGKGRDWLELFRDSPGK